ncbi:hypothetical protein OROMI_028259 [Orobanche minor]
MAIQAQLYSEFFCGPPQDFLMESSYNNNNNYGGLDNLCFVPQQNDQQQQLMQFDIDQFQNSSHHKNNNINNTNNNFLPRNIMNNDHHHHQQQQSVTAFSHGVAAHVENQRMEFEKFIKLQNERLRIAIQHQRKQQLSVLVKKYEYRALFLLTQKEEEIVKVGNRTMELQNFLKRMEMENQTWQRIANDNESMAASLNSTIQRLRESASLSSTNFIANAAAADDAESCCHNGAGEETGTTLMAMCKCCGSRSSCVVMLPCRHLCSCKECEVFLDTCPVCKMVKKGSVEALIQ